MSPSTTPRPPDFQGGGLAVLAVWAGFRTPIKARSRAKSGKTATLVPREAKTATLTPTRTAPPREPKVATSPTAGHDGRLRFATAIGADDAHCHWLVSRSRTLCGQPRRPALTDMQMHRAAPCPNGNRPCPECVRIANECAYSERERTMQ
jgi:hypothetical protein